MVFSIFLKNVLVATIRKNPERPFFSNSKSLRSSETGEAAHTLTSTFSYPG